MTFRHLLNGRLASLLILSICLNLHAQPQPGTGTLSGLVENAYEDSPLPGVTVSVRGTTLAAPTDGSGQFRIEGVPAGSHVILFQRSGFSKEAVEDVLVAAGQNSTVNARLDPEFYEMQTYEAISDPPEDPKGMGDIMAIQQESVSLVSGLSSEMLSRLVVSDAAEGVSKVTGVTVVGGKFAVIRGLSDRYTTTTLNGAQVPSADPDRQAAQLDLFPSSMIERIEIHKTFTPDMPGGFTGGAVNIVPKSFPEEFQFQYTVGGSYNSYSSFRNNFYQSERGALDIVGFDDGTRALSDSLAALPPGASIPLPPNANRFFPETPAQFQARLATAQNLQNLQSSFGSQLMGPVRGDSYMNSSFSVSVGDTVEVGKDKKPLGYFVGLSYGHDYSVRENGVQRRYEPGLAGRNDLRVKQDFTDEQGVTTANWGGAVNLAYKPHDFHTLEFTFLNLQVGEDEARRVQGFNENISPNNGYSDSAVLHYTERTMRSYQVKGNHILPELKNLEVDWLGSLALAIQDEPDFRVVNFNGVPNGGFDAFGNPTTNYFTVNNFEPQFPSRFFRKLVENNRNFKIDFKLPFLQWDQEEGYIKGGFNVSNSERRYQERTFEYRGNFSDWLVSGSALPDPANFLNEQNIRYTEVNAPVLFGPATTNFVFNRTLGVNKFNTDYNGIRDIEGQYIMAELPLHEKYKVIGGVRWEQTRISVTTIPRSAGAGAGTGTIERNDFLPALSSIWSIRTNLNFRLAYGKTLARPTFREMSPITTFNFVGDFRVVGNPNLLMSEVDNYDVKLEFFPKPGETLSIGGFYKQIQNPIEMVLVNRDGDVTFDNRPQGTVVGMEFEYRSSLDFMDKGDLLKNWSAGANFTYISSQVDRSQAEIVNRSFQFPSTGTTRPMFDQSPWIVNADISYDNADTGLNATFSANVAGRRLALPSYETPDIYEESYLTLNFSLSKRLSEHWTLRFTAKNLMDPYIRRTYDNPEVDQEFIFSGYRRGRTFGLALKYEW